MKTDSTTQDAMTTEDALVAVSRCMPSPFNKSRPLDAEFLASVKEEGILQPILLRYHPMGTDYEIVCGHRRVEACKELGLPDIPAVVRTMDDDQVRRAILIENRDRKDLSPIQQAQVIAEYIDNGMDVAAMAAATGWSESMIKRRAKLLELSPSWKKAMQKGDLARWTTTMLEFLVIFNQEQQEAIFEDLEYEIDNIDAEDFRRTISQSTRVLKGVPWKLDDDTLVPRAGSCIACPERSGANTDLFEEAGEKSPKGDRCLNGKCWAEKAAACSLRRETELKETHPNLIKVSKDRWSTYDGVLGTGSYETAKKSDKGALPAMVTDENKAGQLIYVKVKKDVLESNSSVRRAAGGGKTSLKDRKAALEKRRRCAVVTKLIEWVKADDLAWVDKDRDYLVALIYIFGTERQSDYAMKGTWPKFHEALKKKPTAQDLWPRVRGVLVDQLHAVLNSPHNLDMKPVQEIAAAVSADLETFRKAAEEEIPVPKSWATETADAKPTKKAKRKTVVAAEDDVNVDYDETLDGESEGDL